MIKIENVEVVGWEHAIRGMRNPMNSWDKSDSDYVQVCGDFEWEYHIGKNDLDLMTRLAKAGSDHRKFMRMIVVYADITAPLYWWKEYDTYKVGTVANSCSTMHKIHANPFTVSDISIDTLIKGNSAEPELKAHYKHMMLILDSLNNLRDLYIKTNDKKYWRCMIEMLPSSYNQKRTVELNYEALRNMYHSRKGHKLDEWHTFCDWIEKLPHAKELICNE